MTRLAPPPIALCLGAVILTIASLVPLAGFGALRWETQGLQMTVKPGAAEALAQFRFTNAGNATVTITHIQPDCGCTTASVAKQAYAPGEAGVIKVAFTLGDRIGLHEKLIQVITDDGPPVSLQLRVTIPELITITPRLLVWAKGGEPAEQTATIAIAEPQRAASLEIVDPGQTLYAVRFEVIEAGKKYRVFVRPASLAAMTNAPIRCQVRLEDGTVHSFFLYAIAR